MKNGIPKKTYLNSRLGDCLNLRMAWVFLFILVFTSACSKPEIDIEISQKSIQKKIAKKFPLTKSVMVAEFSLHSPQAYVATEKVGLKLKFDAKLLRYKINGTLDVKGALRFDAESGEFFVHQIEVVQVEVADKSFTNIDQLKSMVLPTLNSHLKETPVYTLPQKSVTQQLKGRLLKKVSVRDHSLIATFGP